jgi:hypothetical protein
MKSYLRTLIAANRIKYKLVLSQVLLYRFKVAGFLLLASKEGMFMSIKCYLNTSLEGFEDKYE